MTKEELKQADTKKLISALQYCGRDSYYATYYDEVVDEITQRLKHIEELEKENAELKKDKEELCHSINEAGKACVYLNERISKAKEYIKLLLMNCVGVYESTGKTIAEIQAEAEQFLKYNDDLENCRGWHSRNNLRKS